MPTFTAEELRHIGTLLFTAAGAPVEVAARVAESLVLSNLKGHDSHGIAQASGYVRAIRAGKLDPKAQPVILNETPTTALVDGKWGFGQVAAEYATNVLIQKAKQHAVSAVGIRNCNHIGRLGQYAEQAANAGIIAMITLCGGGRGTSTTPYGGAGRTLGTNPFAFGIPAGKQPPLIADFATTVVAGGKIAVARDRGERIPEGWLVTKDGLPTTDPAEFYRGGMLLTMAGHKGSALSMVAEALGGALTGATQFQEGETSRNCVFMWGVRIDVFQPAEEYRKLEDRSIEKVKATPPAPGFKEVLVPGEPERRTQAQREREGIEIPDNTWESIRAVAEELSVADQLPCGRD